CPLIRPKAARSALRARIIIAMRMPIARPMKMPYQGLSSTRALTRTPRTIAPAMAPIIHGSVERSTSWVYLYTSTICLMRPFFGVPSGFSFCFFFEPFSGLVSGVRAMWGGVLSGRASARGGLLDAGDDARGFLTGGLVRIGVEEVLRDLAAELPHRLRPELPGAVGGADHRPGHDGEEAHLLGGGRERDELLGLDPAVDRVVQLRRAHVLGDREDVAARIPQALHRLEDLVVGLAHAEDEVGLGDHAGVLAHRDHVQRALVAERGTDLLEDPRDRLEVVREHLRPRVEHLLE